MSAGGSSAPAILWDLDGTLVDSEPLHEQALVATLEDEGIAPPDDLHGQLLGLGAPAIHALFRSRFGNRRDSAAWLQRRWAVYLERAPSLRARPGALQAFEAAQALGWQQAVVSNSNRVVVDANLAAIGLAGRLTVIVAAEDVSRPKPDPQAYRLAQQRLAPRPAAFLAVEDSATGARAALAAGCRTFFWPQSPQAAPPGAVFVADDGASLQAALVQGAGLPLA